jgi:cobalt/nickel transport protein
VKNRKMLFWTGMLAALLIAALLSPYASSRPDGLERVAIDNGFVSKEKESSWTTPVSGYEWKSIGGPEAWRTGISGVAGVVLTFGAVYLVFRWLGRHKRG